MLDKYLKSTMRLLREQNQNLLNVGDLVDYINAGRRLIAEQTQSIRVIPPISGSVQTIAVTNGGANYTNPTIVITPPDSPQGLLVNPLGAQATAIATVLAGVITDIQVIYGGIGYFQPIVTITDSTGSGATAVATTDPLNNLNPFQEIYNFSDVPVANFPGVDSIFAVLDVAIIYSNYRYRPSFYDFSTYQASIRQYPRQYYYVPTMWTQYAQGNAGSLYFYPLPSQAYQCEWDCLAIPSDLTDDRSYEALPQPWQDAVPFYAAYLAYLELQNPNMAMGMLAQFDNFKLRYSNAARPGRVNNMYGRY